MSSILSLIGRSQALFDADIECHESELSRIVSSSSFLVLGGAGSIGQAVCREIFRRSPLKLHVVDISENNLVELVRDLRSSLGYIEGEFKTYAIDIGSVEYEAFISADGDYDYVLNLSALKHVRSEEDPYTLMRMIDVNILNIDKTIAMAVAKGTKKYFCVSTDKAVNPVNMMGASKQIMELFLRQHSREIAISTARFANVAFSDGSLLHSFNQRIQKRQPIVAPTDVKRYFVTAQESAQLCLMSCIFGDNCDIFFPNLSAKLDLISFSDIAVNYLHQRGYEPLLCKSESEARALVATAPDEGKWPCFFSASDTTGEKYFEEFYTDSESVDTSRFQNLAVVKNDRKYEVEDLATFKKEIARMRSRGLWSKEELVKLFISVVPEFSHRETGKYLDGKM